jgi:hypothetical protein
MQDMPVNSKPVDRNLSDASVKAVGTDASMFGMMFIPFAGDDE